MRIFVSWSGTRSQAIATALRNWLPKLIDRIELFHSEDIPKGRNWHTALVKALHDCAAGIFCVTPESLKSHWMLFEAGALVQHGDQPTLFTYLYGIDELAGPLSHFQATRFDRKDSRRFVQALAELVRAIIYLTNQNRPAMIHTSTTKNVNHDNAEHTSRGNRLLQQPRQLPCLHGLSALA